MAIDDDLYKLGQMIADMMKITPDSIFTVSHTMSGEWYLELSTPRVLCKGHGTNIKIAALKLQATMGQI